MAVGTAEARLKRQRKQAKDIIASKSSINGRDTRVIWNEIKPYTCSIASIVELNIAENIEEQIVINKRSKNKDVY